MIAVLRDPVERAHSNWTHLWSAGLGPDRGLRQPPARPRTAGSRRAGRRSGTTPGSAGTASSSTTCSACSPGAGPHPALPRPGRASPGLTLDAICAFLGVAPGIIPQVPRENVTAHPEHSPATARFPGAAGGRRRRAPPAGTDRHRLTRPLEAVPAAQRAPLAQPLTWEQRQQVLAYVEDDFRLLEEDHRGGLRRLAARRGTSPAGWSAVPSGAVPGAQRPATRPRPAMPEGAPDGQGGLTSPCGSAGRTAGPSRQLSLFADPARS